MMGSSERDGRDERDEHTTDRPIDRSTTRWTTVVARVSECGPRVPNEEWISPTNQPTDSSSTIVFILDKTRTESPTIVKNLNFINYLVSVSDIQYIRRRVQNLMMNSLR